MEIAASKVGQETAVRHRQSAVRETLAGFFDWFGEIGAFCVRLVRAAVYPPYEWRELLRQCDLIGSLSLPLVALAGGATGVVLSLETRDSLSRFGAKSMLPAVIVFSILKESGPIITGLVVSGNPAARFASAMSGPVRRDLPPAAENRIEFERTLQPAQRHLSLSDWSRRSPCARG
jgi:ABC-type transporter Mla maintaining outer membrane lipid asymmetry permease subunit MlaE